MFTVHVLMDGFNLGWSGGKAAAPGGSLGEGDHHAMAMATTACHALGRKLCRREGIVFAPLVAGYMRRLHPMPVEQVREQAREVFMRTGQEKGEAFSNLQSY